VVWTFTFWSSCKSYGLYSEIKMNKNLIIIIFQIILVIFIGPALAQEDNLDNLLNKPVPTTTNFIENFKIKFNSVINFFKGIANQIINWGIQNSIIFKIQEFLKYFFNYLASEIKQGFENFLNYFDSFIKMIFQNLPHTIETK